LLHDANNALLYSSHPQPHICRYVYSGVFVDPVPASCFQEVSAALLCSNDLHHISFIVQYIRLFFQPFFCEYSYFLLTELYTVLLDSFHFSKLYQLIVLVYFPQQNLHDLCFLVFMHIVHNNFSQDFLGSVASFLSICINSSLIGFQQHESISNQSNDFFIHAYPRGGGFRYKFAFDTTAFDSDTIEQLIKGCAVTKDNAAFVFVDHVDSAGLFLYPTNESFVHVNIPLDRIAPHLPVKMLLKIAKLHHIKIGTHVPKRDIICFFDDHSCASCELYQSVFTIVDSKALKDKNRMKALRLNKLSDAHIASELREPCLSVEGLDLNNPSDASKLHKPLIATSNLEKSAEVLFPLDPMLEPVEYPPPPLDDALSHKIISDFCANSNKTSIEEAGCGVCGQLVPTAQLTRLKAVKNLLTVLENPDVTWVQRKKNSDPVRGYKGPVLDYSRDSICNGCRKHLRNGRVPRNALANGLWLGPVPEELASLGFIEKLLVARVRINSCFIRVASSGLRKMTSHVIAFESPVPKIYHCLPPPMEDLDDVLAVLFTGPCKPTEKEFQRTPLLVRRKKVVQALEWLKLNHTDYTDLEIAYDELERYPENSPPVSVEYQHSETTKIEEGTSKFDNDDGHGVYEGECPFIVHGLSGADYDTKTLNTLKGIALRHWNDRGGALAVSHGSTPLSIYNNPNLYPQIFPWLFPYGLGGIGSTRLSDKAHKQHLLMYHDKRFQKDVCFPFVAFSHQQIKASTTGGLLLAESRNFDSIANRLLSVDQDVLNDLARRMSIGEVIKPSSDDERMCFQLIRDLDHVDGKVDGSITSKKTHAERNMVHYDLPGCPFMVYHFVSSR
jgi:hypothetical protein